MLGFGPSTYGDGFADVYDRWYGQITDAEATAAFIAARCGAGPLLELGVGNGRLVPALREAGCEVIGLDASRPMLERCPPDLATVQADLAALPFRGGRTIGGALCAFNTLFNLPTAAAQGSLLEQLASVISSNGAIVIEAITGIGLSDSPPQAVGVSRMTSTELVLSATLVDHDAQTIQGQHVALTDAGVKMRPWLLRWTTPTELDDLADAAGLELVGRWADWSEARFDDDSEQHVSVYSPA